MQKPTSALCFEVIQFVMRQSQVTDLLSKRDNNRDAIGLELTCKFYGPHPTKKQLSAYLVDFIYNTRYPLQEKDDDISVLVEVEEGNPHSLKIVRVRMY